MLLVCPPKLWILNHYHLSKELYEWQSQAQFIYRSYPLLFAHSCLGSNYKTVIWEVEQHFTDDQLLFLNRKQILILTETPHASHECTCNVM